ncbi:MAG: histidine kinase [Nitrospirae bacterium]|nr:histidine kinase [Nitrospirota bacterium]
MEKKQKRAENIEYIVGAEKKIQDIITDAEVMPILKGAVKAGASSAIIADAQNKNLWTCGSHPEGSFFTETLSVYLEGEAVGKLEVAGDSKDREYLRGLSGLLIDTIHMILHTNLKRMLTTETHTTVVNKSYEELLEINRKLSISESRYRELAENLEKKVQERTEELRRAHAGMLQQEKMAAIGQLAAGVAHEINNPLGFISSNINTFSKYVSRLKDMVAFYNASLGDSRVPESVRKSSRQKWDELKLDFISSDIEELIKQSLEGAERVKKIVSDLKGFSHIDEGTEAVIDINTEIDRTLNVLTHEIPEGTEIIKDYYPLPGFKCNPALLCQVFLNIILNAIQAKKLTLKLFISTGYNNSRIVIRFSDNGRGIPEEIRSRIFEPFYTTKDVGKGMGMGLTAAYETITGYGGTIEVESRTEEGAAFTITLPVKRE